MFCCFSEEVKRIGAEIEPWIIGRKGAAEDFAPIFKENTPESIIQKHVEYKKLLKKEAALQ